VKGLDFWFEITESNVEYLVNLFRQSEPEERKPKASPKKRRRLRRTRSEDDTGVAEAELAEAAEQEPPE